VRRALVYSEIGTSSRSHVRPVRNSAPGRRLVRVFSGIFSRSMKVPLRLPLSSNQKLRTYGSVTDSVAVTGDGVFDTLRAVSRLVLKTLA